MKVLHIVAGLDTGGVAVLLYQYYSHLQDKDLLFDFIIHEDPKLQGRRGRMEENFESLGSKIFKVAAKKDNLIKNLRQVSAVMKNGKYDAVHIHNEETSGLYSALAIFHHIPIRIVHSHYAYKTFGALRKVYNSVMRMVIKVTATNWVACSQEAGIALFGKKATNSPKFSVLHNAITIEDFIYSESSRKEMRETLGINDQTFVIACVGRFTYQKNPERTLEIFHEVCKRKENSLLLMVGVGELEEKAAKMVRELNLEEKVWMLGVRNDVNQLLQAADAFLLPSRFEGLGIVYVEAQAAGLHSYATDRKVPKEAQVCDLLHFCDDEGTAEDWANEILKYANKNDERSSPIRELQECGYDINLESRKLFDLYYKSRE